MIIGLACTGLELSLLEECALARNRIDDPVARSRVPCGEENWSSPYGSGRRWETPHYRLYTTILDPDRLNEVILLLESAHRAYSVQLPGRIEPLTRSTIYLFSIRSQWEAFTRDHTGPCAEMFLKIQEGAYCFNGSCIVYDIGPERTLAALAHEGWHQFTSRHLAFRLPSWLDEGMAMMFEGIIRTEEGFRFSAAANACRLDSLSKAVVSNRLISLPTLLAASPGEVLATDHSEPIQAFYSESYALVRFLLEADRGLYEPDLRKLLADGLWGRWPLDPPSLAMAADRNVPKTLEWNRLVGPWLFRYYVTDDLDEIESQYRAFCARLVAR